MVVSPPPPAVPRWIVTNSRKMLRSPMTGACARPGTSGPAAAGRSTRTGRSRCRRRSSVQPSMTADAPIVQSRADRAPAGRSRRCGPIDGALRRSAPSGARAPSDRSAVRVGHDAPAAARPRPPPGRRRTPPPARAPAARAARPSVTSSRSRSPGTTCRRNLASLTPRSVHARVRRAASRSRSRTAATCASASIISTAGHQRRAREMALEELFVDGDVLDGDQPPARLVLVDRVDEQRRVPVAIGRRRIENADRNAKSPCECVRGRVAAAVRPAACRQSRAGGRARSPALAASSFLMTSVEMSSAGVRPHQRRHRGR